MVAIHGCSSSSPALLSDPKISVVRTPPYATFDAQARSDAIAAAVRLQQSGDPVAAVYIVVDDGRDIVDELLFLHHIYGFTRRDPVRFFVGQHDDLGAAVAALQKQFESVFPGAVLDPGRIVAGDSDSLRRDLDAVRARTRPPGLVPNFYQSASALGDDSMAQSASLLRLIRAFLHSGMNIAGDINPDAMAGMFGIPTDVLVAIADRARTDANAARSEFAQLLFGRYTPLQTSALLMAFCEIVRDHVYDHAALLDHLLVAVPEMPPWLRSYVYALVEYGQGKCAARLARFLWHEDDIVAALIRIPQRYEFCEFLYAFLGPGRSPLRVCKFREFMEKCGSVSESRYPGEHLHLELLQLAVVACQSTTDSALSAALLQRHRQRIHAQCTAGAVSIEGLYAQLCVFFATAPPDASPGDLRVVLGDLLDMPSVRDGLWERFTQPGELMRRDPHGLILRSCPVSADRAVALLERVALCDDLGQYSPESARYYPLLSVVPERDPRVMQAVSLAAQRRHSDGLVSAYRQFRVGADRIRSQLQSSRSAP